MSNDLTDLSKELENNVLSIYLINPNYTQNLKFKIIRKRTLLKYQIIKFF